MPESFALRKKFISRFVTAMSFFYCAVCQNLYNRLCNLWDEYCQPEAYRFVREKVIDRYRYSCPITCGKCSPGQKMLDANALSKYIISQTSVFHFLEYFSYFIDWKQSLSFPSVRRCEGTKADYSNSNLNTLFSQE